MLADKLRASSSGRPLPVFVSSSLNRVNGTSNTVTEPADIQDGDLLVALTYTGSGGYTTITPPAGFSQIYNELSENPYTTVNVKVASAESGNYTFAADTAVNFTSVVLVYRNATQVNTISGINRVGGTTANALSITPTHEGVLVAVFSHSNTATIVAPPSDMTQRVTPAIGPPYVSVYDLKPQNNTSSGDKTLVWGSSAIVSGLQLQITNEPTVTPEFVSSASTQNASSGTTLIINKPASTVVGDLMVAVCAGGFGGSNNYTFPAGWIEVADRGSSNGLSLAYKVAGSAEGASYTITATNSNTHAGAIITHRHTEYDTIGVFVFNMNPLIIPSITVNSSQSILIAAGAISSGAVTLGTPSGMYAKVTNSDSSSPSYIICSQPVAAGKSEIRSMSTGSTSDVAGILMSIKPTGVTTLPAGPLYIASSSIVEATSNTISLNISPLTQDGDLMIAFIYQDNGGTFTAPAGWTIVKNQIVDSATCFLAYKVASSESSTTGAFNSTATQPTTGFVTTYRNAAFDVVGVPAAGNIASSITVTEDASKLLYFAGDDNTTLVASGTFATQRVLHPQGLNSVALFENYVAAGATGPVAAVNNTGTAKDYAVLLSLKSA